MTIVEADGNDAIARFSLELGVRAGVHITTLPVVPATQLADRSGRPQTAETVGEIIPE